MFTLVTRFVLTVITMPIVIKDYKWEQSDTEIFITVPLKAVKTNKVDVFTSETYVKVWFL